MMGMINVKMVMAYEDGNVDVCKFIFHKASLHFKIIWGPCPDVSPLAAAAAYGSL
jgi:hypothetical protein